MKVIVTKSEINGLVKYFKMKKCNPCEGCPHRHFLCGEECDKIRVFNEQLSKILGEGKDLLSIEEIRKYAEAEAALDDIENRIAALHKQQEDVVIARNEAAEKINIEE